MPGHGMHRTIRTEDPDAEGGRTLEDGKVRRGAGGPAGSAAFRGVREGNAFRGTARVIGLFPGNGCCMIGEGMVRRGYGWRRFA